MSKAFQVLGQNSAAPFTLKAHRGDGMVLLAMNWKDGTPQTTSLGSESNTRSRRASDSASCRPTRRRERRSSSSHYRRASPGRPLVGRGLHRSPKDPRPGAVRVEASTRCRDQGRYPHGVLRSSAADVVTFDDSSARGTAPLRSAGDRRTRAVRRLFRAGGRLRRLRVHTGGSRSVGALSAAACASASCHTSPPARPLQRLDLTYDRDDGRQLGDR
jgi:hypothetical protein